MVEQLGVYTANGSTPSFSLNSRGGPCISGNGWCSQQLKVELLKLETKKSFSLPVFSSAAGHGNDFDSGGADLCGQPQCAFVSNSVILATRASAYSRPDSP